MPLGIHLAWDWGESYFYGLQDAGFAAVGHLFGARIHGSALLTGGAFGPEASIFNLVLLAIWGVIFSVWLRGVRYPNPGAVQQPPDRFATLLTPADRVRPEYRGRTSTRM